MGCGQSKKNLYPRRNKSGGKAGSHNKKSGGSESNKDTDEEGEGAAGGDDVTAEERLAGGGERTRQGGGGGLMLPLCAAGAGGNVVPSASQQDFFKMLDQKIEQGRDYDSNSDTEKRRERERRNTLIRQWRSTSLSSQPSPPTPARRRVTDRTLKPSDKQSSPLARRCLKNQQMTETNSPPSRRCQSAQGHHPHQTQDNFDTLSERNCRENNFQVNGNREWLGENSLQIQRPQSAGANWKLNPKVAPFGLKTAKRNILDASDETQNLRSCSPNQRDYTQTYIPHEYSSRDELSQITYNPTFQSHSPAHVPHTKDTHPQPYIAQIITYPVSQHIQHVPEATPYISPPPTYQDEPRIPKLSTPSNTNAPRMTIPSPNASAQVSPQSNIYFISPLNISPQQSPEPMTQKQQIASHLQQYVAMKQAQHSMYSYIQRMPGVMNHDLVQYQTDSSHSSSTESQETIGQSYCANFQATPIVRPHTAPGLKNCSVRANMAYVPNQIPSPVPVQPISTPYGQFSPGDMPPTDIQYYHQSQLLYNRPGSAGTLTRYKDKQLPNLINQNQFRPNLCQSINIVRQKPIGQIVSLGGQGFGIYQNSDIPSSSNDNTCLNNQNDNDIDSSNGFDKTKLLQVNGDRKKSMVAQGRKLFGNQNDVQKTVKKIEAKSGKKESLRNTGRTQSLKSMRSVDSPKDMDGCV